MHTSLCGDASRFRGPDVTPEVGGQTGLVGEAGDLPLATRWRICFVWTDAGPEDGEIVDYH
jgi:hypothetical protein